MNITPETKLGALLKEHPQLIEFLPTLSPAYENLKNPILRRTMLGRATLGMIAERGGIEVAALIEAIEAEISRKETSDDRIEVLKGIIRDLHAGVDMEIIDVTDPAEPVHVGTFNDPNNGVQINTMQVVGNYLYTAKGSYGIRIYDITTPLAPAAIGIFFTNGEANDFVVDGNVTYVLDGSPILGLRIVNSSNPSGIYQIGNY